jgi:hypothetical protein
MSWAGHDARQRLAGHLGRSIKGMTEVILAASRVARAALLGQTLTMQACSVSA